MVDKVSLKTPAITASVGLATCSDGSIPYSSEECGECIAILCCWYHSLCIIFLLSIGLKIPSLPVCKTTIFAQLVS